MKINNVHSRTFNTKREILERLLNSLSSPHDQLWPTQKWPPMKFDRPLGVGAQGGHGPVRYQVIEFEPGRKVCFQFNATRGPCVGLLGLHWFIIEDTDVHKGLYTLKHVIQAECHGLMKIRWLLLFRWLHDALIEDALDRAEQSLTGNIARPSIWTWQVRLLRRIARFFKD